MAGDRYWNRPRSNATGPVGVGEMTGKKSDRRAWLILFGAIALAFVAANVYHVIWGSR